MNAQWHYNHSLDLLNGNKHEKNIEESFKHNEIAAKDGHHDATLAMGWYYLNGYGIKQDVSTAIKWYKKSARQKEPKAMFSLGQIAYFDKDYATAHKWFEAAKNHGHIRSIYWIGKLYWRGHGVNKDKELAEKYFQNAANKKYKIAQRIIGKIKNTAQQAD